MSKHCGLDFPYQVHEVLVELLHLLFLVAPVSGCVCFYEDCVPYDDGEYSVRVGCTREVDI